jgi:L-ascorbate metabolism protein UlaG (beta-lactamase superfamily)
MHEVKLNDVAVTWFGHASFLITNGGTRVYVDPFVLPNNAEKADIILISHDHFDHCYANNINKLRSDKTKILGAISSVKKLGFGAPMTVDKHMEHNGVKITAVEAYNISKPFHPRGLGIGFVIEMASKKIYHAGDTDNIPEMAELQKMNIDIALLPIGGHYTMNAAEAAEAAKSIRPKFLVPMHYNSDKYGVTGINADPIEVAKLLIGKGIVVNIITPMV